MNRRDLLKFMLISVGGAVVGTGLVPLISPAANKLLRPPGATNEKDFLGACIKCGLCVQICPVSAIKLADINEGIAAGTAYINPREGACDFSCIGVQCTLVCPTGALLHENAPDIQSTHIGFAVLNPSLCLHVKNELYTGPTPNNYNPDNYKWKVNPDSYRKRVCSVCVDKCPLGPNAITIEQKKDPKTGKEYTTPVVHSGCTGCGVCEMVCPVPEAAIVVVPWKNAGGKNV